MEDENCDLDALLDVLDDDIENDGLEVENESIDQAVDNEQNDGDSNNVVEEAG